MNDLPVKITRFAGLNAKVIIHLVPKLLGVTSILERCYRDVTSILENQHNVYSDS